MSPKRGTFRVGTSGYQYKHWKKVFYPEDISRKQWFDYYAEHFDTVEINNTFYHLPQASTFDAWHEQAPPGFCYALKFSRYGSHLKKLKNPEDSIRAFLDRAERLKSYIGPILVQLPPHWGPDPKRLDAFLKAAPRRRRWAVEFREKSWLCEDIFKILRRHNAALVVHDMIGNHPREVTADWVYLRYHGAGRGKYTGKYSPQALSADAERILGHQRAGRDVYAYFNNDQHGYAIENARQLRRYVKDR